MSSIVTALIPNWVYSSVAFSKIFSLTSISIAKLWKLKYFPKFPSAFRRLFSTFCSVKIENQRKMQAKKDDRAKDYFPQLLALQL
jgi:hypothetical protein